jgi:putative phosphoesterase
MKLLIASDIHGSYYYAKKLIDVYKNDKFDKILLLGDVLYHGPRNDLPKEYNPKKVIELLNPLSKEIVCVRGNCDAEVDDMVLDFDVLSDHTYYICDDNTMYLSHGHHSPKSLPPNTIYLSGHTHIPLIEKLKEGIIKLNPGSISIPKGGFPSTFAIYENNKFTIYDFDNNILDSVKIN